MASFVRLMVVKQRTGWGYQTLLREVSDSLHLRRFCLIALTQRVADESTVRKLARRLGPEVVAELTRVVVGKACRQDRFAARAVRVDSTVVEADVRYPSDGVLALQGARPLAREGRKLAGRLRGPTTEWLTTPGGSASWCGRSPRRWSGAPGLSACRTSSRLLGK
jgi:IS5 family transposase